ncbi:RNA-directed DNA polymerase, eukaryota [Tanacetum coccineum]
MGAQSNEDHTMKISKSVFVTNFPEGYSARDLWKVFSDYGTVVDAFIPFKKSKAGKRFAFVRFIKRPAWGFQKKPDEAVNTSFVNVLKSNNFKPNHVIGSTPAIALDDSCLFERDFSLSLMGKTKDINAMSNLYFILANEGFENGEIIDFEDTDISSLSFKKVCIKTKPRVSINEKLKVIVKGRIHWIRLKELQAWYPDFKPVNEDINSSDEDSECNFDDNNSDNFNSGEDDNNRGNFNNGNFDDNIDHVSKSSCMYDNKRFSNSKEHSKKSEDPFEIYKILNRNKDSEETGGEEPKFPPGFTPIDVVESKHSVVNNKEGFSSVHMESSIASKFKTGGSILEVMEELITLGQTIGLGNKAKKGWIQELNSKHRVNFVAIQETKMEKIDLFSIKALWGNFCFDHAFCPSIGFSGGTWVPSSTKLLIISVYAPQELSERKMLWDYFHHLIISWDGECVILGDFNEVRSEQERHGTVFNLNGANVFNNFISTAGLVDIPLEGYSFTWSHKSASKMSKLNRLLITEGLLSLFPSMSAICLDRHLSDHRPILLRELNVDYGPSPFCFFHSWFHKKGFDNLVEITWNNAACMETNVIVKLKKKLQALQIAIKQWVKDDKLQSNTSKMFIQSRLTDLDKIIDQGKGDENSKYFHGIINKKRSQLAIRGVLVDDDWIDDPSCVKNEFLKHFSNRFAAPLTPKLSFQSQFPNRVTPEQIDVLESIASYDEIKRVVWDCGINKSPSPDGFSFEFYRKYWDIVDQDMVAAVLLFFSSGSFPTGCNSSFIALIPKTQDDKMVKDFRPISLIGSMYKIIAKILANRLSLVILNLISDVQSAFVSNRQILDGPFILNELISWCKRKNTKAMIFKVDFEKAFDSMRWDFLDEVLKIFGFGDKWRSWIQGCLSSSMGSILVNGSPTSEFKFYKGLKQGDPLSPFLFILIMESLHISLCLSHLFYADDVVFVGKRDTSNFAMIVKVLKWFFLASGLKINIHKSKLIGIGIPHDVVVTTASSIGCSTLSTPFNYLGVQVGGFMARLSSWDDIIAKISSRLSKWKLKTLSIGGRFTLMKSVLSSLSLHYFSIFKVPKGILNKMEAYRRNFFNGMDISDRKLVMIGWKKILASKKNGGLGVSSLFALNRALLFKWIWRFTSNGASLWPRLITAIHGVNHKSSKGSLWLDIIRETQKLSNTSVNILSLMKKKWVMSNKCCSVAAKLRDSSLISSFSRSPRGGIEDDQLRLLEGTISPVLLSQSSDRWIWRLDSSGEFSVKSARNYIDDSFLPKSEAPTRWIGSIPIKVNIFAWKVCLDKLPTRLNLSLRGLDIPSILCPNCFVAGESSAHFLFSCDLARQLSSKVSRWWEVDFQIFHSYGDWLLWFKNLRFSKRLKDIFEGVWYVTWYVICKFRNQVLFGSNHPRLDLLFDEITRLSFTWCSSRCISFNMDWNTWIKNPSSFCL